jgi:ParB family chromosome partitioning protein
MILVSVERLLPNPEQPRKTFDQAELQELADSIKQHGVIQPIIAEVAGKGNYIIHDGERRLRASKLAGLKEVPVDPVDPTGGIGKEERLMRAMVANIQRADLNPIDEAHAYQRLKNEFGLSENQIALKMGTNYARVNRNLKLLKLETSIQKLILAKRISPDPRLVDALMDIPVSATREKMAIRLANSKMTIPQSVDAIRRVIEGSKAKPIGSNTVPAFEIATRRAGKVSRPAWDAFAAVGKLPPWVLFEISVRDTCKKCSLVDNATVTTCKDCPVVDLVIQMIGKGDTHDGY